MSVRAVLARYLLVVVWCAMPAGTFAQARLVTELSVTAGEPALSSNASAIYRSAGGLRSGAGAGVGAGVQIGRYRLVAFANGVPNNLRGLLEDFQSNRIVYGVRADALLRIAPKWSIVPTLGVTRQRLGRAYVSVQPTGGLSPVPAPRAGESDDYLSWGASTIRVGVGVERELHRRYAVGLSGVLERAGAETGQWRRFSTKPPGVGVSGSVDAVLRYRFGRTR